MKDKYRRRTVEEESCEIEPIDDRVRDFIMDILDDMGTDSTVTLVFSPETVSVGVSRDSKSLGTIIDRRRAKRNLPHDIVQAVRHLTYGVNKA